MKLVKKVIIGTSTLVLIVVCVFITTITASINESARITSFDINVDVKTMYGDAHIGSFRLRAVDIGTASFRARYDYITGHDAGKSLIFENKDGKTYFYSGEQWTDVTGTMEFYITPQGVSMDVKILVDNLMVRQSDNFSFLYLDLYKVHVNSVNSIIDESVFRPV